VNPTSKHSRKPRSGYFWLMFLLFALLVVGLFLLIAGILGGGPPLWPTVSA